MSAVQSWGRAHTKPCGHVSQASSVTTFEESCLGSVTTRLRAESEPRVSAQDKPTAQCYVCDLDRDSLWSWDLGRICAGVRVGCASRVRTRSVDGSKFDLRLRSGLCLESRSKPILCPRARGVHVANSQEFTTFWLTLWARPCASQCLWECQNVVFSLPSCESKWQGGTWGPMHVLVWWYICSEDEDFSRSGNSLGER